MNSTGLILALLTFAGVAQAAELTLNIGATSRIWSTAELLAHPRMQQIEVAGDVSYKRNMSFQAVPLAALLTGVQPGDHLQVLAIDGFAAELSAAPLLKQNGAQAWLAMEDPALLSGVAEPASCAHRPGTMAIQDCPHQPACACG